MKKLFIWWHRRRLASHDASAAWYKASGMYPDMSEHICWRDWHSDQISRLTDFQVQRFDK